MVDVPLGPRRIRLRNTFALACFALLLGGCDRTAAPTEARVSEALSFNSTASGDLAGYWPGEGNFLDVAGSNHGTPQTETSVGFGAGRVGQPFRFTGSGGIRVEDSPLLEPSAVTVSLWAKPLESPGSFRYLVAKGANTCTTAPYALYTGGSGGLHFYISPDGSSFHLSPNPGQGIWDGNWHHIVGTYDGTSVRLYVDGSLIGGTPASGAIQYGLGTDEALSIGGYGGGCLTS